MDPLTFIAALATALFVAIPATIAAVATIRGNRHSRQAQLNTEPNGGSSNYDLLIARVTSRIDGWGMTLEREIQEAAAAAAAADINARAAADTASQAAALLPVIARDLSASRVLLDGHLVSSAEFGGQIIEGATEVLARLDRLEGKESGNGG